MTTGLWDVIIPVTKTNLITNPSFEAGVYAPWGGYGASVFLVTAATALRGAYSLKVTAETAVASGAYYSIALTSGTTYTFSADVYDATSSAMIIGIYSSDGATAKATTTWTGDRTWKRKSVSWTCDSNATYRLEVRRTTESANFFNIDGLQLETGAETTYIDGDVTGFMTSSPGYKWNGTPHASTSTRSAQERSGGTVTDIYDTYNVVPLWADGIGMAPITHHTWSNAMLPGAQFMGAKVEPRAIDLTVLMSTGHTPATIHSARKDIIDALKLDLVVDNQPVVLRYRGALSTKPVEFRAYYDTGLNLTMNGAPNDQPVIRLICYDPFAYEVGDAAAALTATQSVSNADYAVKRIDGTWSNISTTFDGIVRAFAKAANGNIYIGGMWAADVSTAADGYGIGVIEYNPTTGVLTSLGTGLGGNKDVKAMAVAANGDLYIGGDFLNAGGVANADYIAYWDISAAEWVALSATLLSDEVRALAFGNDGKLYAGGLFLNVAGGTTDYIVSWDGTNWGALGTGMQAAGVSGLAVAANGDLYATGAFTTAGGVASTVYIAKWNGTAWSALSTGLENEGYALAIDSKGIVYVTGEFDAAGGVTTAWIAAWNGQTFVTLGTGLNEAGYSLDVFGNGNVLAGGYFTAAGGVDVADRYAVWNGYTWSHLPVDLPGTPKGYASFVDGDNLYLGYDTAGTATSAYLNTVTNAGTARAYPVCHIKRTGGTSANAQWLKNTTTGATIYLDYDLQDGEELILDFRPGSRAVKSSFYGSVWRAVLRGSDFSGFYLAPGSNSISAYVKEVGSPTVTSYLTWTTTHMGADGVAA